MFGYVKTDLPYMYMKDTTLYKAMYCGLCKGIGCACGTKGRLVLNYDLTFLSVLAHNLMGIDVKVEKQRCIAHQIKKRPVAVPDALTERIGALNVILAYHKLNDDVLDSGKGKTARRFFLSSYKKAKKKEPEFDKIVEKRYSDLVNYEKTGGDSIDISADPFGNMMVDVMKVLLGDKCTENVCELSYELGKWIYLIDALDDFDKDKKKNNFNVFINANKDIKTKEELIEKNKDQLIFTFGSILSKIASLATTLEYKFNHDLTDNILLRGLRAETQRILENKK
ncbi:MAG: hypothetical protein IJC07_01550 [Clostridia bacterium]|nr:hypothetical protein [Clostridia bacterium]